MHILNKIVAKQQYYESVVGNRTAVIRIGQKGNQSYSKLDSKEKAFTCI